MPYYWKAENRPSIASMTLEPTVFDDGVAGDTTTGQEGTDTENGSGTPCPTTVLLTDGYITVLYDFLAPYDITALQFTRKAWVTTSAGVECNVSPDDPPEIQTEDYAVEYSSNGVSWTSLATGGPITADNTYRTASLTPTITARYVWVVVHCFYQKPRVFAGTVTANARVTDFRLTGTLTPSIDPPDPPDPEEEGTPTACTITLSWDEVAGAEEYELQRRRPSGEWDTIYQDVYSIYADDGVESGQAYDYRARALAGVLTSEWSGTTVVESACGSHWVIPPLPDTPVTERDCQPEARTWTRR